MKNVSLSGVVFLVLLLSACDKAKESAEKPMVAAPQAAPTQVVPAPPPLPEPPPVKPTPAPPKPEVQRLPAVSITNRPMKHPEVKALALPELDLSVPEELLESVELGEALPPAPLLPALFGAQKESDFRLNGRLINSGEEDKMFEGAELSFEFKN